MEYWETTYGLEGLFKLCLWRAYEKIEPEFITNDGIERYHEEMLAILGDSMH